MRRLDAKLNRIAKGADAPGDFIIADAKDADMGFGALAGGPERGPNGAPTGKAKPLAAYLAQIKAITAQDLVDVMLLSASNAERLIGEGVFDGADVTPAIRGNDATDIWNNRGGSYRGGPSRPFRSASLSRARELGVDLCLYSITFCDALDSDLAALEAFAGFRADAEAQRMRYFLEVFNPNAGPAAALQGDALGAFVNDGIIRSLAGLTAAERPKFLKVAYNGPRAMEELCGYDPSLVVGIMGGAAGTARDTFELLAQAARYGAKVALFGRKINHAEAPLQIIAHMRRVVEGLLTPEEAVRSYHDALTSEGVAPARALPDDLQITDEVLKSAA